MMIVIRYYLQMKFNESYESFLCCAVFAVQLNITPIVRVDLCNELESLLTTFPFLAWPLTNLHWKTCNIIKFMLETTTIIDAR